MRAVVLGSLGWIALLILFQNFGGESLDDDFTQLLVASNNEHGVHPSISVKVGAIDSSPAHGTALNLKSSELKSIGIFPGQEVEVESKGNTVRALAYDLRTKATRAIASVLEKGASQAGIEISEALAEELKVAIGDEVILRPASEPLPRIIDK